MYQDQRMQRGIFLQVGQPIWARFIRCEWFVVAGVVSNGQIDIPRKKPRKQLLWVAVIINNNNDNKTTIY